MGKEIRRGLIGAALGILASLSAAGTFAWMLLRQLLDMEHMDMMAAGILILGSGAAALFCGAGEGRGRRALIAEGGLIVFLGLLNLALFDGALEGVVPCLLLIGGTAGAVLLLTGRKHTKTGRKRRQKKAPGSKLNKNRRR